MTTNLTNAHLAAAQVKQAMPGFKPLIGVVLGSGLGSFADKLSQSVAINYAQLPGFPEVTIEGHSGQVVLGYLSGVGVVCLQGRVHSYEGLNHTSIKTYVRMLKLLGCEYFLATNASGSMRQDVGVGELMLITDHINLQPYNPLVGSNDDEFGPRFFPLDNAYDLATRNKLMYIAEKESITLHSGVYISVLGPNFETAAEIKAFRMLGADAVGMSTVPEVLVANHCGMKVAVIAIITNFATGLAATSHSHENVIHIAAQASEKLNHLLTEFIISFNTQL